MATPTPGSASRRAGAAGGVSTPSYFGQGTPAPRSVPSPNTARHHPAGKTPINHPTTGSSHGSKTLTSTPMVQSLSQSGNSVSPGVNALGTPGVSGLGSGLGIDGITPSALHNIPTPLALSMGRGDSDMRVGNIVTKRNEDEERRVKMRKVLTCIGNPKGRVSEEGIARFARRVGMATDIDDEKLSEEARDRKVGNRSFSVAGENVIVDIDLKDQVPQSVEVNDVVPDAERAGQVLLRDLKASSNVPLTASLDDFALNLSYLARMDRLKKETGTDCFAAIGGVHQSLRRLHDKETEAAAERVGREKAQAAVLCKMSGQATMHARSKLGCCLDYSRPGKRLASQRASDEADADKEPGMEDERSNSGLWTLDLGAQKYEPSQMLYPPLRVSDQWLPESFELPAEQSEEDLPWLEPANAAHGLCFMAKLNPPVALPYMAADAICKSFNVPMTTDMQAIPSYVSMLLSTTSQGDTSLPSTRRDFNILRSTQAVVSGLAGEDMVQHHYTLDSAKLDFGYTLRELPFSHPKQLVELLPTLRQWAGFGVLISQCLETGIPPESKKQQPKRSRRRSSLEDLLRESQQTALDTTLGVNMSLSTTPQPTFSVTFQGAKQSTIIVDIQILRNADVAVEVQDGFDFAYDEAKSKAEAKMAKALDVCWDLGVWIEWVRGQDFS